jgi:hypothetical protein
MSLHFGPDDPASPEFQIPVFAQPPEHVQPPPAPLANHFHAAQPHFVQNLLNAFQDVALQPPPFFTVTPEVKERPILKKPTTD